MWKLERGAKLLQHKIFSRVKWFRSSCVTTIRNYYYAEKVHAILISRLLSKRKGCYKFFDYSSFIKQENLLIYYLSETVIGVKFYNFFALPQKSFQNFNKDVKCWGSKVLRNHQKVSIELKQEKISNNKTISILVNLNNIFTQSLTAYDFYTWI